MRPRSLVLFALVLALAAAAAAREPVVQPAFYNVLSDNDEAAFGRSAAARVEKEYPLLDDPLLLAYLDSLGQPIVQKSQRANIRYTFRVIDSPQVNAFALPGGYVYVTRGLLDWVKDESELAGVLAHEISHVVARHGANAVSRELIAAKLATTGAGLAGVSDESAGKLYETIGSPVVMFATRPMRQEDEIEADRLAVYNVARAGFTPEGIITALERTRTSPGSSVLQLFLSTHPPADVRIPVVRAEIAEYGSTANLARNSIFFDAAKARMLLLPPPKGK